MTTRLIGRLGSVELRDGTCDALVFGEVFDEDVYRMHDFDRRLQIVRNRPALDLGANVGAWTLRALDLGASHVHAVEPFPANVEQLRRNLAAVGMTDRVTIHEAACIGGDLPDHLFIVNGDDRYENISYQAHTLDDDGGVDGLLVPTVPIDRLLEIEPSWGMLKCDIEGGEYDVFNGVSLDLMNRVAGATMEFHGPGMGQHCAWIPDGSFGTLVTKLSEWGHVQSLGAASRGGQLYASRY